MNKKIIVLDDVLSLDFVVDFSDIHFNNAPTEPIRWVDKGNEPLYIRELIKIAENYFDLTTAVGYEWWTQNNTYTNKEWHYDTGVSNNALKAPLCSIICYPLIAHLNGG